MFPHLRGLLALLFCPKVAGSRRSDQNFSRTKMAILPDLAKKPRFSRIATAQS
jgi:hypothetical protein